MKQFNSLAMKQFTNEKSFTLIELVIVIGILAVLAVVVILAINPSEFLKQSRDSSRMTELKELNKAILLYQADGKTSFGSSSVVYVSIPDSSLTCANLGLPSLPTGWEYRCSNADDYRKVNSSGWVPVPFTSVSWGAPLNILPIDPINTTSTGNYYTYVAGGSWNLTAFLESEKYKMGGSNDKTSKDNGSYPELYEVGTNLALLPVSRDPSLVGYWKFDDGTGTTAYDASGNNNTCTLTNGPTWTSGKVAGALSFDGVNDYVSIPITFYGWNAFTIEEWIYPFHPKTNASWSKFSEIGDRWSDSYTRPSTEIETDNFTDYTYMNVTFRVRKFDGTAASYNYNIFAWRNQWIHVVRSFSVTDRVYKLYINGEQKRSDPIPSNYTSILEWNPDSYTFPERYKRFVIGANVQYGEWMKVIEDELRIYNRALSAAEIQAIYNATK